MDDAQINQMKEMIASGCKLGWTDHRDSLRKIEAIAPPFGKEGDAEFFTKFEKQSGAHSPTQNRAEQKECGVAFVIGIKTAHTKHEVCLVCLFVLHERCCFFLYVCRLFFSCFRRRFKNSEDTRYFFLYF